MMVAIAWAEGTMTLSQASAGFGKRTDGRTYVRLALALKQAMREAVVVRGEKRR